MNDIDYLFFELIRVAIGTQDSLSRVPSVEEWRSLYEMAKKQSLVGVCFAGVQRMCDTENDYYAGLTEMQYLTWMGMATIIKLRNEKVNKHCVELLNRLETDGFDSLILKGQSVASLYKVSGKDLEVRDLSNLRQSGDIDIWAMPKDTISDGRMVMDATDRRKRVSDYCRKINAHYDVNKEGFLHTVLNVFDDVDVEWHFTPSSLSNPLTNSRLQKWFESEWGLHFGRLEIRDESLEVRGERLELREGSLEVRGERLEVRDERAAIKTPSVEFNLVFLLLHIYRHYLYEGIGMRQLMDYYFVLRCYHEVRKAQDDLLGIIKRLKIEKFAGAVMYVMREVFGMDDVYMICPIDKKRGKRMLEVIMEGGNFGHGTEKYKVTGWDKPWNRLSRYVRRNWYMLWDYPNEIVWNVLMKFR